MSEFRRWAHTVVWEGLQISATYMAINDGGEYVMHDDYNALRAEAEALRAALLGIASVNPAERGIEWAKSYASDGLKGAGSELYARWLETFKEAEALRAQVSALQSDANSWQSGYDKGREDGAKAAEGWKAQHARDSVEMRMLCAERDALAAELKRWERSHREVHEPALREAHAYIQELRAELEAARGLLRHASSALGIDGWESLSHEIDTFLTATPAPEVPDHIEQHLKMVEQGERQEAVAWALANSADEIGGFAPIYYTKEGAISWANGRNIFPLYTTPQPGQDVRALAASLYQACGAYDMPERILDALSAAANGEPFTHMIDGLLPCVPPSGEDVQSLVEALEECAASLAWNCFGECRAVHAGPIMPAAKALDTARAALAAHRQAQRQ